MKLPLWIRRLLCAKSNPVSHEQRRSRPHLEVLEDRLAPAVSLTDPDPQLNVAGSNVSLILVATNSEPNTVIYSAVNLPPGLDVNAETGEITGQIDLSANTTTPYEVLATATDSVTAEYQTQSFDWTVKPEITLSDVDNQENYNGAEIELVLTASNSAGRPLTFSAVGLPDGLVIDDVTGTIAGAIDTAVEVDTIYTITVTATDSAADASATQTFQWLVHACTINSANPGDQQNAVGDSVNVSVAATDSLGGTITYSAIGLPGGLTIDSNGVITGTIAYGAESTSDYFVTVIARNAQANSGLRQSFFWTVSPLFAAPAATNFGPVNVVKNGSVVLDTNQLAHNATNPGGALVNFIVVDEPPSGTLTMQENGTLLYVPDQDFTGADSFTYKLVNSSGESSVVTVFLIVSDTTFVANDVFWRTQPEAPYSFTAADLIANASTTETAPIELVGINGVSLSSEMTVTLASGATITRQADGSFVYQSLPAIQGQDSFTFTLSVNNLIVTATANMLVAQGPGVRLGQPIPAASTLWTVLAREFENWKDIQDPLLGNEWGISLDRINTLIQSRTLTPEQAAAVAMLKVYVLQAPDNLLQIGEYGTVFGMMPRQVPNPIPPNFQDGPRWVTMAGINAFQLALGNPGDANHARARAVESIYQDMLHRAAMNARNGALLPNAVRATDLHTTVRQGYAGDCSFMSAVVAYIRPTQNQGGRLVSPGFEDLRNRIREAGVDPAGVMRYDVTLFTAPGTQQVVRVTAPTLAEQVLYGSTTDGSIWLSVLEKAYVTQWPRTGLQRQGLESTIVYDVAANGERLDSALIRVTGREFGLQGLSRLEMPTNLRLRIDFLAGVNGGAIVTAGSRSAADIAGLRDPRFVRFPSTHAFAIVGFDRDGPDGGTVTLRNPWNNAGQFGGQFTLSLNQFRRLFNTISVATPPRMM